MPLGGFHDDNSDKSKPLFENLEITDVRRYTMLFTTFFQVELEVYNLIFMVTPSNRVQLSIFLT